MTTATLARLFLAALLLTGITAAAVAEETTEPAAVRDCSAPEYRQFDFKLGSFDVSGEDGGAAGKSTVESILGGCMLVEHWHSVADRYGRANIYYDRSEGRWHLDFFSDDGETLRLQGGLKGEAMVLTGDDDFDPFTGLHRMTWSPLPQGDVRQFWELSHDGGLTWATVFTARYARRP